MNQREEYKSIHQNSLRFLKDAKNLPHITNKKAIPYYISNLQNVDIKEPSLSRIKNLFEKKFPGYKTNVSILGGLSFSSPSMLFQVNLRNGCRLYESIAISFSESEEGNENISWPLLLVLKQSKHDLLHKIHNFIQRTLKCVLKLIRLSESQTIWLIGISINEALKRNLNCGMSLTCKLPTKTSAEIDIFFSDDVLSTMWNSVHDSISDIVRFEELEVFFAHMSSHVQDVYGFDLSQLIINSFLLKGIRLQFHEQFQINAAKTEIVYLLLSYIISDCLPMD